jgi:hypothetical protein
MRASEIITEAKSAHPQQAAKAIAMKKAGIKPKNESTELEEEFEVLHNDINELITGSVVYNSKAIVAKMKKIVPEFKSMNSTFEVLDK